MYNKFSEVLSYLFDKNCPYKTVKVKKLDLDKPFIGSEIKAVLKEKHRLQRSYTRKPITFGDAFRAVRNKANKLVTAAKKNYYRSRISSSCRNGNSKNMWNILNNLLGRQHKDNLPDELLVDGELCRDKGRIANGFNQYFCSIGEKLSSKLPQNDNFEKYLGPLIDRTFIFEPCSAKEIEDLILALDSSTSPGIDEIPVWIFKDNVRSLLKIITGIYNLSMSQGTFPEHLAGAVVICLYKSGNPLELGNYRGISLLVIMSKILEKVVAKRLTKYFTSNSLFTDSQFGFREGMSTENAIQVLVNAVYDSFEQGNAAIGVFVDLSKAFDSLDRDHLCTKLEFYGIKNNELKWFRSYVSNRKQCVKYKNTVSNFAATNFGVSQGGVLSALLYIIYVNDIVKCINNLKFVMYADDTCIFAGYRNLESNVLIMNRELEYVSQWMIDNRLTVNVKKSNYVIFSRAQRKLEKETCVIHLSGSRLAKVKETKYLGVKLDEYLMWIPQVNSVVSKVCKYVPII